MSKEVESAAREMGWKPEVEFRGDAGKWVDAQTFVNRGENFIPILRADRDAARAREAQTKQELAEIKRLFTASQEAIEELKTFHTEDTRRQVEKARKDMVKEIKSAREAGDVDGEIAAQRELTKLDLALEEEGVKKPAPKKEEEKKPDAETTSPEANPHYVAFVRDNPWFNTDARLQRLATVIGQELRADPQTAHLTNKAFFDRVEKEMQQYLDEEPQRQEKVGGGRSSGSGASTQKTGYDALPEDAKAVCNRQAKKLVGEGRAFKDEAAWRTHYAEQFFATP